MRPIKFLKFMSFRGLRSLDPIQGFALGPLGASKRPPDLLPQIVLTPSNCNSWIRQYDPTFVLVRGKCCPTNSFYMFGGYDNF